MAIYPNARISRSLSTPTETVIEPTNINERQRFREKRSLAKKNAFLAGEKVDFDSLDQQRALTQAKFDLGAQKARLQGPTYPPGVSGPNTGRTGLQNWGRMSFADKAKAAGLSPQEMQVLSSRGTSTVYAPDVERAEASRRRMAQYGLLRDHIRRRAAHPSGSFDLDIGDAERRGEDMERITRLVFNPANLYTDDRHLGATGLKRDFRGEDPTAMPNARLAELRGIPGALSSDIDDIVNYLLGGPASFQMHRRSSPQPTY